MKAARYTTYGPPEVLAVTEVEKPTPAPDEVLVRVHMSTMNRTDCGFRSAKYLISRLVTGLFRPRRPIGGSEFAGEVVEIGDAVTNLRVGDRVFGFDDVRGGGHAEYKTEPAHGPIAVIPEGFDYRHVAAAGEGATYALSCIRAAGVQPGHDVMVYGASGAIGSAAVQILASMGARVVAVCGTKDVKLAGTLGAHQVIDYQTQDFTEVDDRFDFVFDAVGKSSYGVCSKLLKPRGKYCSTELGRGGQNPLLALWFAVTGSHRVLFPIPKIDQSVMQSIAQLLATGAYRPVIDRSYSLGDIVEAARYVEIGQKTGNVLIIIDPGDQP